MSPAQWDAGTVVECCTEVLPRKVSAEISLFEAISPVLNIFFTFLEQQSLQPRGYVLAEAVENIHDEILATAQDQSNWGPAKRFVMSAQGAGVDINDDAAMQAFMLQFNQQKTARSRFTEVRPAPGKQSQRTGRYEPCPCGSGKKYKFCCE